MRRPLILFALALGLAIGGRAAARFYAPDPTSPLYETTALVAGRSISVSGSQVTGDLRANGDIHVGDDSRVTGNAAASGHVEGRQRISGMVEQGAPPIALPKLPTAAEARAIADRMFSRDTTFTDARIDDVVFVGGDVRVRGSLNGTGSIVASGDIVVDTVDDNGNGGDDRGGSPQQVHLDASTRLSLVALGDLRLGQGRALRGLLMARQTLELAGRNQFDGVLVALGALRVDEGSVVRFVKLDRTPPVLSSLAPADGSLLATATPAISGQLADDLSGVDPATFKLTLDGLDRTSAAAVSASGFSFTPAPPLADGTHAVTAAVADRAGNPAQAKWSFTTDVTPPTLTVTSPGSLVAPGTSPPIAVAYGDATSGIDLASLRVSLDGADLTRGCTVAPSAASCPSPALGSGGHAVAAQLRDRAGNPATASLAFQVALPPALSITSPASDSFTQVPSVQVSGTINSVVTSVKIGDQPATLGPGSFTATASLTEGPNALLAVASDGFGNQASDEVVLTLDTHPPVVTLAAPAAGLLTNQSQVRVAGTVTDETGIATFTVAGQTVALTQGAFAISVPVAEGTYPIVVDAVDLAGNKQQVSVTVTRFSIPTVAISSPPDLSYVSATTVAVSGTVSEAVAVSVNGVAATLSGTTFTAPGVPLVEGGNSLTATATDARGHAGLATINVVRDLTPPHVAIYTPAPGATIAEATVTVTGLVNDIVAGSVNTADAQVTVNGIAATVANRSFLAAGVPLQPGINVITAVAVDASGNQGRASVTIRQAPPSGPRVAVVSGSGQGAVIAAAFAQPLVAVLLDAAGQPVAGKPVLFQVRGGDGTLEGGRRDVAVVSDASGRALAHFTAGTRAGTGNQVVEASAAGFGPPAVFFGSALPGPPARIVVDAGDQQLGVAGQALPRPLVATVVDAGANRLAGITATFAVTKGAGHFANGQPALRLASDSDGRLIAALVTDPAEGVATNVVRVTIDALPAAPPASFVASTWAAGDPALTAVSGVVLDNSNLPIAGVTVRLRDTLLTATTDAQGLFRIAPAPVGTLKLIIDGSTAQRPGAWPDLEFDLTTVPGRDNTLRMPIYLLPLDLAGGVQVDETHGGRLTLPQLPGFALEILPGSVTFPNGGRSGLVSVTVVHSDKVPMVPNFGQQPRLIVTIQPAGARFDPPARLTMPNVEGLAPGQVTDFYSFDHDLGHFVSIGPGTVSDDGMVVTSNPGVGILKAGWHCCGYPQGTGAPNSCPDCTDCTGDQCKPREICSHCTNNIGRGYLCDGADNCAPPSSILPDIARRLRLKVDDKSVQTDQCRDSPLGPPNKTATCGVVMTFNYAGVDPHCGEIDLSGSAFKEVVECDNACARPRKTELGSGCNIYEGNSTSNCHDEFTRCRYIPDLPMGDCTETCTQKISWQANGSDALWPGEQVTARFTFHKTQAGCTGSVSVTRMP